MRHHIDVHAIRDRLDATASEGAHGGPVTPFGPDAFTVLEHVGSTNAYLAEHPAPWAPVIAEHQGEGRGRLGRSWQEVPRAGIAMSVLVAPPPAPRMGWLPLLAGLAVRDALAVHGLPTTLKWPNDVLVPAAGEAKVCGVLAELRPEGVIVGIGINVDHTRAELPVSTATSVRLALGSAPRREIIIADVLSGLASYHQALLDGGAGLAAAQEAYREASATLGASVDVHRPGRAPERVEALDIDASGGLRVRGAGGSDTVTAGDVQHIRRVTEVPRK